MNQPEPLQAPPRESYEHVLVALRWATKDGGLDAWAKRHNISPSYLYRVLNTGVPPSARLCKALGFERKVVFTEAGK